MNSCVYCGQPTQQKVCMSKPCRNKYKQQHYRDNVEHYRLLKKEEQKKNGKNREPRKRVRRLKQYYENFANTLVKHAKSRAKTNSLEFDLDREFIEQLYEQQGRKCALTGISFQFDQSVTTKRRPFGPSLDRVDCAKGYTRDNVRLVCSIVNIALSDFGDEAFDKMCREYMRTNAN